MENEKRKERGERGGEEEERSDGRRGVVCKGLESRGHERREERRENSTVNLDNLTGRKEDIIIIIVGWR